MDNVTEVVALLRQQAAIEQQLMNTSLKQATPHASLLRSS